MKKILLILLGIFLIVPSTVSANYLVSYHNYGVTEEEKKLMEQEQEDKRNFFEELEYRFIEKTDRDMVDYTILTILIVAIVMVIIFLNKKTYIVVKSNTVFEEEPVKITDTIDDKKND